uniref:WSN domain-containing protein n=1 Tax=Caenorhabditis tropicalis TaxID=1561998 RepID=A0A1I7UVX6_9PELO
MKILQLWLVGLLLTVTSTISNHPFSVISDQLAFNARLATAISGLALFVQSSSDSEELLREVMSVFFRFERSVIDDFRNINEADITKLLQQLDSLKSNTTNVAVPLENSKVLMDIEKQLSDLEPEDSLSDPTAIETLFDSVTGIKEIETTKMVQIFEELKSYSNQSTPEVEKVLKLVNDTTVAVNKEWHEWRPVIEVANLGIFKKVKIYERLTKDLVSSILSAQANQLLEKARSILPASKMIRALKTVERERDCTIFPNHTADFSNLSSQLSNSFYAESINEAKDSSVLKEILSPVHEISKKIRTFWDGIQKPLLAMSKETDVLDSLLTLLDGALDQNETFQTSLNLIGELSQFDVLSFNLTVVEDFQKKCAEVKDFDKDIVGLNDLKKKMNKKDANVTAELKNFIKSFEAIQTKFGELKVKPIQDLRGNIPKDFLTEITGWINKTFENFKKNMAEKSEAMRRVNSGFKFLSDLQSSSFSLIKNNVSKLVEKMENMKKGVMDINEEHRSKSDPSDPKGPHYKYMIQAKIEMSNLGEQFASGAVLYKLFHRLLQQSDLFHKFFMKGEVLLRTLPANTTYSGHAKKAKKLLEIEKGFEKLKNEIRERLLQYDGKSILELLSRRSFIDGLQRVTDPKLKTTEWKEVAEDIGDTDFLQLIGNISNLDFASHHKKLIGAYAHYRGYLRYNQLILNIAAVQEISTYEANRGWYEFGIHIASALVLNALLYSCAFYKLKYDEMKDAELEKMQEEAYWKWRIAQKDKRLGLIAEEDKTK